MTGRPVPRSQLPAGAACILTADGSPPDATELAQIEQFKTFLRRAKEVGEGPACAEVYGDECQEHGGCRYCRATTPTATEAAMDDLAARKAEIHRKYTDRLKAMSPKDPMYQRLWDERAEQLRALAPTPTTTTGA